MSGDIGLEQPIIFYHKRMTEAKQILLRHKGIELAYLEINSQKDGDPFNRRIKKKK
jgi:hypothetical protein